MLGQPLGHYRIESKLGQGGMGVVYRAHDETLDRDVALKVLAPEILGDDAARARFRQEALALSRLNHPNICTIYEVGEEGGQAFLAMEYVEGRPLRAVASEGALPVETSLRYGVQMADALAHAHTRGIVHRDLKSANVMVTPEGRIKVLDFGLARRMSQAEAEEATRSMHSLTGVGTMVGTLHYMPPEVFRGEPADARGDLWALGVVLHEMSAGELPFRGQTGFEVCGAILNQPPATLPERVPPALQAVIGRCLAKAPGERYQRAEEVRAALETLQSGGRAAAPLLTRRRLVAAAGALALILLAVLAVGLWRTARGPAGKPYDSIAILPFVNASGGAPAGPDSEYLSDGIADNLISSLSRLPGVRVISRSATFRYKGKNAEPRTVGRELNVQAVLLGRLLQRGDSLTISVELVDARDNRHLWGEHYRRSLAELQAVEQEIGQEIAGALRLRLTGEQTRGLARQYTPDSGAYQDYLRGRYFWNKRTGEGLKTAIGYFDKAIARDPAFPLAYSGLADAHVLMDLYAGTRPRESYPRAKAAALQALRIDDALAEAYATLGRVKHSYEWDWRGAERDFRRSLQLKPAYATAHLWYGIYLQRMRRTEEALEEMKRAEDLDPISPIIPTLRGDLLGWDRRYDEAIDHFRRALAMDPSFGTAHFSLGRVFAYKSMHSEAMAEIQTAIKLQGHPETLATLAWAHAVSGNRKAALQVLDNLLEHSRQGYFPPVLIGVVYTGLGDHQRALEWLRKGFDERDPSLGWLHLHPALDPLRSDPRFAELLRRMNLPSGP